MTQSRFKSIFLDTLGETIDGIITLSLDDYFEVPLGTQAYDLNLINLNNQGLTFKNIVITPRDTKFEIETFSSGTFRMVSIWDRKKVSSRKCRFTFEIEL